jgi:hypothetical protein
MCIKSKPRAGKDKLTKKYIDGDGGFALCGAEKRDFCVGALLLQRQWHIAPVT